MNSPQRAVPVRDRFYARTFALVTALLLGIALFKIVQPFFGPLLWAMFIAFLLHPLHVWLTQRLKGRAQLSAALLTVLTLIVLVRSEEHTSELQPLRLLVWRLLLVKT